MYFIHYVCINLGFLLFSCNNTKTNTETLPTKGFAYELAKPSATFELSGELNEVSGLSMSADGQQVVAIQDEAGILFFINPQNGRVERRQSFWKEGDYEGVEIVGDRIFVTKNSGTLYEIQQGEHSDNLRKHKGRFDDSYDVEGLCYDSKRNKLLMACKAKGHLNEDERGIFGFDLATNRFDSLALFTIKKAELFSFIDKQSRRSKKTAQRFQAALSDDFGNFSFSPSAIARHPLTGDFYISSSAGGKFLLVIDATGKTRHMVLLDKNIHRQPEGIAFDEKGNLYIANEAKKGSASKLYRFDYKKK